MPRQKKPVTTKKGQHHKFKSFMMNLVKGKDISKVDTNVLRKHKELFEKKKVTFEKRNADPAHIHDVIYHEFPSVNGMEFSLWRLPKNNSTLIPFPKTVNNAVALCNYEDLNRSVIYIRLMAAPGEMQEEVPESSHICEPDMNQDASSDDSDDDEESEEEMEVSVSREQTMPEHIPKKRKHFSESEDRSKKRKSHSTGAKYEGIPSSLSAVLEEDGHEVTNPMASLSSVVAIDVNVSSVHIDAGSENNLSPQDTLIAQMIPVPVLNHVINSQPSILDQFADVASTRNASGVASLPIECIDNACQEQFLNTQTAPGSYLNFLTTGSVNQPDLQNQFTNSNQIESFDSNGCNENDPLNDIELWQQEEFLDSCHFTTDITQSINQFSNLLNVYDLSTTGRQDSNPQLAGLFGLVQTNATGQGLMAVSSAPTQFIPRTMTGQGWFPVQSATSEATQSHLQTSLHSVALSTPSIVSRIVPEGGIAQPNTTQLSTSTGAAVVTRSANANAKDIQESSLRCRNFLSKLMILSSNQPKRVAQNIKNLIQDYIDGNVEPEDFAKGLKVSPRPWLVPFLKDTLPFLRQELFHSRMTIDGIRPPPASVVTVGLSLATVVAPAVPVVSIASSAADLQTGSIVPNSLTMQPYTTSNSNAGQHNINSEDASIEVPTADPTGCFRVYLGVIGLAALDKRLYIISRNSETVTIHSSHNPFKKISDHKVKGMKAPFQIFASSKNSCLYIVDANKSESKCIWKATDDDEFIANRLMEDVNCCCLSVTYKGDLVLLDDKNYCLHLYNSDSGRCFHCIHLSKIDRKAFGVPHFVISSLDNAFYISITDDKTEINMVYKISRDGELLNTFGGRGGEGFGQLSADCHCPLILDRYGRVIVLDSGNNRVLLLNSNLEYMTELLSYYICDPIICNADEDRLFTSTASVYVRAYNVSQFEPDNLMRIATQKPSKFDDGLNEAHMLGNISTTQDIRGVAVLLDKIYILASSSICIHSCVNPFKRIRLEKFKSGDFWDIAADDECDNRCLYVTDKAKCCIWLIGIDLRKTKWLQNIRPPYSLSVSKDGSVVIPNNNQQSIDVYKGKNTAQLLLSIKLYTGVNNRRKLRHAIKVQEHYVVCYICIKEDFEDVNDDYVTNGVLLVSTNGDVLRSLEGLSRSNKLNLPNHLAVDREGGIIVADSKNKRVIRLNGKLEQEKILLSSETQDIEEPRRLSYDWKNDRLLVCHSQSLDIFSFSLDLNKHVIDPKLSPGIESMNLRQDVYSCEFLEFQKINQMDNKTMKYKDKSCYGVAILHENLYLIYYEVASVCVHQSDPPFDLIDEIRILGQDGSMDGLDDGLADIVASSAHDLCYIASDRKIWYLLDGSRKADEFLESEEDIRSMSVTAEGQLLVVYDNGKLATYNYNGECTECIFPNDSDVDLMYGVKTGEGKFICITSDGGDSYLKGIYKRSVDGSDCCFYGPFDMPAYPGECIPTTLGEDGQVFILLRTGEVLSYDYKRHLLSIQLNEDDHKMSDVTGFCYSWEKKQLLVCGDEGIVFLQMLQNKQTGQNSEKLEFIKRKNSSNDKSSKDKRRRWLYSVKVDVSNQFDQARGIARLGNNTYILLSSKLLVINSKDIRKKNFMASHHSLTIPEPTLGLIKGGLRDIAASHVGLCLYVTDKKNRCVWSVTIGHKISKWLDDIDSPYTLSVTNDGSVCILDNSHKQLDVYDSNAVRRKSIRLPRFMNHLRHAVQTSSGNFVICCNTKNMDDDEYDSEGDEEDGEVDEEDGEGDEEDGEGDEEDGEGDEEDGEGADEKHNAMTESSSKSQDASESLLYEISPEGDLIRRFRSTESPPSSQLLVEPLHLAIDANDRIFVIDGQRRKRRILLFDNQLKCIENVTSGKPFEDVSTRQLFYDSSTKELLVICIVRDIFYLLCLKI